MKRLFDFFASLIGLILISPILLVIGLIIVIGSKGPVFYIQKRIGIHFLGKLFMVHGDVLFFDYFILSLNG